MTSKVAILAGLILAASATAQAQQTGQIGAGVILGIPIGGTVKYWITNTQAFDAAVGISGGNAVLYGDYLWHTWDLFPQPDKGKLGAYVGLGPRLETESDPEFGLRTIAGMDYWIQGQPIEVFLEGGPVFQFTPETEVDGDVGVGVRFYFGGGKTARSSGNSTATKS